MTHTHTNTQWQIYAMATYSIEWACSGQNCKQSVWLNNTSLKYHPSEKWST
jgi:hypothetical protein